MRNFGKKAEPHIFMTPAYIMMLVFMGYPLVNTIRMAFLNYKVSRPDDISFAGFGNFQKIFEDINIGMITKHSLIFVFVTLFFQFTLGFILALALKKPFKGRGIYQAIVFCPWAFSGTVVGLVFKWMFNGEYGFLNSVMMDLGLIDRKISFLGMPGWSLASVIIALVWQGIPFFGIMILAALQSVPEELIEAAKIDGAGSFKRFLNVTVPCIKPTLIVTVLLRTIWIFNNADLIYTMTGGGPANTSHNLSSYMFTKAYATLDYGFASALGVLFMLGLTIYIIWFFKITKYNQAGDNT